MLHRQTFYMLYLINEKIIYLLCLRRKKFLGETLRLFFSVRAVPQTPGKELKVFIYFIIPRGLKFERTAYIAIKERATQISQPVTLKGDIFHHLSI